MSKMFYFPLDLSVFENERILTLQKDQGHKGVLCFLALLCLIYKAGYYIPLEDAVKQFREEWEWDEEFLRKNTASCAKAGLLHEEILYKKGVLTSQAIQRRYIYSMRWEKSISMWRDLFLLGEKDIPPGIQLVLEGEDDPPEKKAARSSPALEEVLAYAKEIGYSEGERFFRYYEKKKWRFRSGTWQDKLREWKETERKPAKTEMSYDINDAFERALRRSYHECDQ